jgi:hypothetical protein
VLAGDKISGPGDGFSGPGDKISAAGDGFSQQSTGVAGDGFSAAGDGFSQLSHSLRGRKSAKNEKPVRCTKSASQISKINMLVHLRGTDSAGRLHRKGDGMFLCVPRKSGSLA